MNPPPVNPPAPPPTQSPITKNFSDTFNSSDERCECCNYLLKNDHYIFKNLQITFFHGGGRYHVETSLLICPFSYRTSSLSFRNHSINWNTVLQAIILTSYLLSSVTHVLRSIFERQEKNKLNWETKSECISNKFGNQNPNNYKKWDIKNYVIRVELFRESRVLSWQMINLNVECEGSQSKSRHSLRGWRNTGQTNSFDVRTLWR